MYILFIYLFIYQHIQVTDEFDDIDEESKNENKHKSTYFNSLYSILQSNSSKENTKRILPVLIYIYIIIQTSYIESEYGSFYREYSIIERMKYNIIEDIIKQMEKNISNSFYNYKSRSRQFNSLRNIDILPVSVEFVKGLVYVKNIIKILQEYCYKMLYEKMLKMLGNILEKIIYNVAIEYNSFNIV